MGNIVDGIQRPLRVSLPFQDLLDAGDTEAMQSIQELSKSIYIPRGINTDALERSLKWDFNPVNCKVRAVAASLTLICSPSTRNVGWRPHIWR